MKNAIITPADVETKGSFTSGIQEAVDALPRSGGIVHLPPGEYRLRRSVFMPSNVTVRGEGPATVVSRAAVKVCMLAKASRKKVYRFALKTTRGLRLGDQVCVCDDRAGGWHSTHGVIREMDGNSIALDFIDDLPHLPEAQRGWVYRPEHRGRVTTGFPAFWAKDVRNVAVENLAIRAPSPGPMRFGTNFVLSAVHTAGVHDVRITGVHVKDWPADGISVQGGGDAVVTCCVVEGCRGHGLHPGSSTRGGVWSHNISRANHGDGYYFCLRVTDTICQNSLLVHNKGNGIANLSDPDRHNVVMGNICSHNGRHGIEAANALENVIQGNVCLDNSHKCPGVYSGIYLRGHRGNTVTGNVCTEQADSPQAKGLTALLPRGANAINDNL